MGSVADRADPANESAFLFCASSPKSLLAAPQVSTYRGGMPSQIHEALVDLFRCRPDLVVKLLRDSLGVEMPEYTEARIESADLSELKVPEYRADLVILLAKGKPREGIVLEMQRRREEKKLKSWPSYGTLLRARHDIPVCVVVITPSSSVARWAAEPIYLGGGNYYRVLVIGPDKIPVVTDEQQARQIPELAVLSAIAHGKSRNRAQAVQIALAAQAGIANLDEAMAGLYYDLIVYSMSQAARRELQSMDPATYRFKSDFAKHYFAAGKQEGQAEGKADLIVNQLTERFGRLDAKTRVRISSASQEELNTLGKRLLSASTLDEVLASLQE